MGTNMRPYPESCERWRHASTFHWFRTTQTYGNIMKKIVQILQKNQLSYLMQIYLEDVTSLVSLPLVPSHQLLKKNINDS